MKALCLMTVLVLGASSAAAQTLDQTFDQIGSKLEAAQQSLAVPPPGSTVQLPADAQVYTRPDLTAVAPLKLDARTQVTFQGVENGFVKLGAPGVSTPLYVPWKAWSLITSNDPGGSPNASGFASGSLKSAIDTVKGLASDLRNNPYVRLKGFSISVALPPSLNIDFEMRETAGAAATPSGATPAR